MNAHVAAPIDLSKVLDAEDLMNSARSMIECLLMAAGTMADPREVDAITTVADIAIRKLEDARDILDAFRALAKEVTT